MPMTKKSLQTTNLSLSPESPEQNAEQTAENRLTWMETLLRLNQAILSANTELEIARRALPLILELEPEITSAGLYVYDETQGTLQHLHSIGRQEVPDEIQLDEANAAHWVLEPETWEIRSLPPEGSHSEVWMQIPLLSERVLVGMLYLAAPRRRDMTIVRPEWLVETAVFLALGLQNVQRRQQDSKRRQEAELMRDMMGALASSADLNQTLEIILINLRSLVNYDTARLFLLEKSPEMFAVEKVYPPDRHARTTFQANEPIVSALQARRRPLIVGDTTVDVRFQDWAEMETVRSWMGVPIFAGDEMLGFLSLGSLEIQHFKETDAELMQVFGDQVGQILERNWLHEQSRRQSEELEVLSKITFALGQAGYQESIFPVVVSHIARLYDAASGAFLYFDKYDQSLFVRYSQVRDLQGMILPPAEDIFWEVYHTGVVRSLEDLPAYLRKFPGEHYQRLFAEHRSAILVPVKSQGEVLGVLVLLFDREIPPFEHNIGQLDQIATIAGFFLGRTIFLEALEKQLQERTRQLTTLYLVNQVAGETWELDELLEQLLDITLDVMGSTCGGIALVSAESLPAQPQTLSLVASKQLPERITNLMQAVPVQGFWEELLYKPQPLVVPNLTVEPRLPPEFRLLRHSPWNAGILTPIRVSGRPTGVIGIFNESFLAYSPEDITLFSNVADQIGTAIERVRLAKQAHQTAVFEERQRLARELHDSITQLLYSQVLFAGASLRVLAQKDLELLRQNLERLDAGAQQALKEMRLLVYGLRPALYLQEGLAAALQYRLDAVEKRSGIHAELYVDEPLILDEMVEITLYRIVEEALNNTLKHSSANNVTIRVMVEDNSLLLEIADNGCGFEPDSSKILGGMGLHNIRERTEALGGSLEIDSQPGEGTCIRVRIDLET
jgi:signal transduction histidine kinase